MATQSHEHESAVDQAANMTTIRKIKTMRHTFSFPLCVFYNAVIYVAVYVLSPLRCFLPVRTIYLSSSDQSLLEWEVNTCKVCFMQVRIANFVNDDSFDGAFVNL